jgi:signal transduction histidine kinase
VKNKWVLLGQVGVVAALCIASIVRLWQAGTSVVAREQNRQRTMQHLVLAEEELARAGVSGLLLVPAWPDGLTREEWTALDTWLSDGATRALATPGPALDGGYFLVGFNRFVGRNRNVGTEAAATKTVSGEPSGDSRALIEAQVHQALDEDRPLSLLLESPPRTFAIRVAPVWINGRQVAATWTLAELHDASALASAVESYRLSAALALGGIAFALVLSLWLAWMVRRQAQRHARLEADLRRSERLAALGRLVAGVAHEVRNPLAGIRSTAQLCERGIGFDEQTAGDLILEVDRLDSIVSRLLQFARVGQEAMRPTNINQLVLDATKFFRSQAEELGVLVEFHLDHSLPDVPLAPSSIVQLVRNLASNALQAMPMGGVLRIATLREPHGGRAVVTLADTGPGLNPEVTAHLFEPFFTTKTNGTGLGLAIAREIALAHNGELSAANAKDGRGAVFKLSLPLSSSVKPCATIENPSSASQLAFTQGPLSGEIEPIEEVSRR